MLAGVIHPLDTLHLFAVDTTSKHLFDVVSTSKGCHVSAGL